MLPAGWPAPPPHPDALPLQAFRLLRGQQVNHGSLLLFYLPRGPRPNAQGCADKPRCPLAQPGIAIARACEKMGAGESGGGGGGRDLGPAAQEQLGFSAQAPGSPLASK